VEGEDLAHGVVEVDRSSHGRASSEVSS